MAARRPVDVSGLVAHVREPAAEPDSHPAAEKAPARPRKARSASAGPATQSDSAPRARARSGGVQKPATADPGPEQDQKTPASAPKAPARKRATKAATQPTPDPEQTPVPAQRPEPPKPTVLATSTAEAKRIGLYLHPDDYRALGMARLDDGADANARIRAMIAIWRANPRFRHQVDRLARTSTPRQNQH